uniref:NR LBD domain-containing protein n=1 Tax=Caenorhabditis tropicalis TaxID=1561998 RepID=A0A1I7T6J2_9PELO
MLTMIQEHGSCSALTLLLTGKLFRNAAKELLSIKTLQSVFERKLKRRVVENVQDVYDLVMINFRNL